MKVTFAVSFETKVSCILKLMDQIRQTSVWFRNCFAGIEFKHTRLLIIERKGDNVLGSIRPSVRPSVSALTAQIASPV